MDTQYAVLSKADSVLPGSKHLRRCRLSDLTYVDPHQFDDSHKAIGNATMMETQNVKSARNGEASTNRPSSRNNSRESANEAVASMAAFHETNPPGPFQHLQSFQTYETVQLLIRGQTS